MVSSATLTEVLGDCSCTLFFTSLSDQELATCLPLLSLSFQFAPLANNSFTHFRFPCRKDINKLISGQKVYLEFDSDVENILNDVIKELLELTVWVADVYVDGNVLGGGMQFG